VVAEGWVVLDLIICLLIDIEEVVSEEHDLFSVTRNGLTVVGVKMRQVRMNRQMLRSQ
jgi:hypothetical protein